MSFAYPAWLIALALLPLLVVVAVLASRSRGRAWRVLAAPRLRGSLIRRGRQWRYAFRVLSGD